MGRRFSRSRDGDDPDYPYPGPRADMKSLFYVAGVPGSGKSSVVRELITLGGYDIRSQKYEGIPHIVYQRHGTFGAIRSTMASGPYPNEMPPELVELGVARVSFPGTDALAMNILPRALQFLAYCPYDTIIAEGDRLAHMPFLNGAKDRGWKTHLILLDMSEDVAALRRVQRGSHQNPSWIAGRITKAVNLGKHADITVQCDNHTAVEVADVIKTYMQEQING